MKRPFLLCAAAAALASTSVLLAAPQEESGTDQAEAKTEEKAPPPNPVYILTTNQGEMELELFLDAAPETVESFIGLAEGTKEFTNPKTGEKEKRPYFDGLIFHRVIKDFMIQGGCPLGTGTGSPGFTFKDEINGKALGLDMLKVLPQPQTPHPWLGVRDQASFQRTVVMPLAEKLGIKSPEEFEARRKEFEEALEKLTLLELYEAQGYQYDEKLKSRPPVRGSLAMANSGPNTNGSQFFLNLQDTPWLTGKHTVFGQVVKGFDILDKIGAVKTVRDKPVEDVKILSIKRKPAE